MNEQQVENPMSEQKPNPRTELLRKSLVLQVKLVIDGLRDAALIPLALIATVIGLLRSGDNPEREFQRVVKLGRRSERWINVFGHQPPLRRNQPGGSLDGLLDRVEEVVMDQYRKGRSEEEARAAIKEALNEVSAPIGPHYGKEALNEVSTPADPHSGKTS